MVDLNTFCGKDSRAYLRQPFSVGQFTYASDGYIAVRVPRQDEIADSGDVGVVKRLAEFFADVETKAFRPCKFTLPEPPPARKKTCPECGGTGHEHDCPDCLCECDACDGTGTEETTPEVSVDIFGVPFNRDHLALLTALPDLAICVDTPNNPACVRFTGGFGIIMARRDPAEIHILNAVSEESP